MALTYGFYDSISNDRTYNAEQMSKLFEGIITEGIFQTIGGALVVSANSGLNINVAAGRAWFFNTWTNNDAVLTLVVSASDPTLNRIDRVILEVDKATGVRANSIKMLNGTAASIPTAPTLANTATKKQYALADIYVAAGATVITAGNITNKVGTAGTPFITGIINTIDTATLLAKHEATFELWMANLIDQLNGTQVTNLQAQIDALVSGWVEVPQTWTYFSADAPTFTFKVTGDVTGSPLYRVGNKIKLTQTTAKYFIITKTNYSAPDTSVTIYGGTDYTLTSATITLPYTSGQRFPMGFPALPTKWQYSLTDAVQRIQTTPSMGIWTNPGSLSIQIPIGEWRARWIGSLQFNEAVAGTAIYVTFACTLSTANNSQSSSDLTNRFVFSTPNTLNPAIFRQAFTIIADVSCAVKTQYFFNLQTSNAGIDSIEFPNHFSPFKIVLESAYL
jgi:hypothetical protein